MRDTYVIHCETIEEFERLLKHFNLDPEYMDWGFYGEDTVLYPNANQYGDINGYCVTDGLEIIKSQEIQ